MTGAIPVLHILEATTGGTGRHLKDLVLNLDRDRFAPSVICSLERDVNYVDDVEAIRDAGIPVTVVPMVRPLNPARDFRSFTAIRRHVRESRPTVVHAHSAKAGFLGRHAACAAHVPRTVYTPHGYPFQMDVPRVWKSIYFRLEEMAAQWTDVTVCVSREELHLASSLAGPPTMQTVHIPNGVQAPPGTSRDEARRALHRLTDLPAEVTLVGAVGRLTRQKGFADLVAAAPRLLHGAHDTHIVIIGAGEDRPTLDHMVKDLQLTGRVHLLGPQKNAAMLTAGLDVLAMPSRWEGLPYALLDAMAAGVPAVASRVGGIPDVIDDRSNGVLVTPGDTAALVAGLNSLLESKERRSRLGEQARETIRTGFALDGMVQQVEALYERLVRPPA